MRDFYKTSLVIHTCQPVGELFCISSVFLQDDGWLLGVQETHWLQKKDISVKGVFPENFTQKV